MLGKRRGRPLNYPVQKASLLMWLDSIPKIMSSLTISLEKLSILKNS
jgi:hypothetical protein